MKLLIINAIICDIHSAFNGKKCNLLISNGVIEDITLASNKNNKTASAKIFDASGAFLSPGFVDMRTSVGEPGHEFKEDLNSVSQAAASGGYTSITALPDTSPVIQHKGDIEFVLKRAENLPVHILPYGAVTFNRNGEQMNELFDMHNAGAVAFTDANKSIMNPGIMLRALQYAKIFNGLLIAHADDRNISAGGKMHEGMVSVNLGLKGIPSIAEELMISRDIELVKYTESAIHISHVSSKNSVDLIRKAKKQGVQITCDVAVANLVFTDENLSGFDSNFKLTPPLRSKTDQKALWEGIDDGTIDCIVSDHHPENIENKNVEFDYATQGIIMLQTAFSLLTMHTPKNISTESVVNALTHAPRKILKQTAISINKGNKAELCIFDTNKKWEFNHLSSFSKSINSPLMGQTLSTRIIATYNKNKLYKHLSL